MRSRAVILPLACSTARRPGVSRIVQAPLQVGEFRGGVDVDALVRGGHAPQARPRVVTTPDQVSSNPQGVPAAADPPPLRSP